MRVIEILVKNYKSLKNITFHPEQFTVLVGANASGKSNFSDCVDFISEVYRHGLEVAVSRKGGFENIAFRRQRRSRRPIEIKLTVELSANDYRHFSASKERQASALRIEHQFTCGAKGYAISAEFAVKSEVFRASVNLQNEWNEIIRVERHEDSFDYWTNNEFVYNRRESHSRSSRQEPLFDFTDLLLVKERQQSLISTELFINSVARFVPLIRQFVRSIESFRVFQISPTRSREFGVPTPRPELDRSGANLPAVIDLMIRKNKRQWNQIIEIMRSVIPNLEDIEVDYTTSRTLGLFFKEEGYGRSWSVDEVSDGTIHTLAILVAIYGADSSLLIVEEPENSVHPWIIRQIINACREASKGKQVIITSHSPVVINQAQPHEIRIIWRGKGESHVAVTCPQGFIQSQ